jgi:hypothetical protein
VLVIGGAAEAELSESDLARAARTARDEGLSARDIMEHLTKDLGAPRNLAYRIAHGVEE